MSLTDYIKFENLITLHEFNIMEIWLWINITDATKQISKPTRDNYKAQYKHDLVI